MSCIHLHRDDSVFRVAASRAIPPIKAVQLPGCDADSLCNLKMGLEPAELARWTRFAGKGGIGKCTAKCDCVAESSDDLMFLKASPYCVPCDSFFRRIDDLLHRT